MKYLKLAILLTMLCSSGYVFGEISPEWTYDLPNSYSLDDILSITQDGKYIAVGSNAMGMGRIYYFNKNGELLWVNNLSKSNPLSPRRSDDWSDGEYIDVVSIDDLKISSDGKYVIASIENISEFGIRTTYVYVFNNNGKILKKYKIKNGNAILSISPDDKYIFVGDDMHAYLIDIDKGILLDYETDGYINSIDMASDDSYAVAGCEDGKIYVFNISNHSLMWKYQTNGNVKSVSINSNKKLVGAGGLDGYIYILNYSGKPTNKRNLNSSIYYLKLTDCNDYNIIAYNGLKIYYLDKNLATLWTYYPNSSTFIEIKDATPDGKYMVVYDDNYYLSFENYCEGCLEVLNDNGTIAWAYPLPEYSPNAKISYDGKYVVGIIDGKLYLFDNQKCIENYEPHKQGIMTGIIDPTRLLIYFVVITIIVMVILLVGVYYIIKLDKKERKT